MLPVQDPWSSVRLSVYPDQMSHFAFAAPALPANSVWFTWSVYMSGLIQSDRIRIFWFIRLLFFNQVVIHSKTSLFVSSQSRPCCWAHSGHQETKMVKTQQSQLFMSKCFLVRWFRQITMNVYSLLNPLTTSCSCTHGCGSKVESLNHLSRI